MTSSFAKRAAIGLWQSMEVSLLHNSRLSIVDGVFEQAIEVCKEIQPIRDSRYSPTGLTMDVLAPSVWHATCYLLIQYFASRVKKEPFHSEKNLFETFYGNRPVYRGQSQAWNIVPSGWRGIDQALAHFQREVFTESCKLRMTNEDAFELDLFGRVVSSIEGDGLARHYDIPTNLVDFTFDPRIAVYFACGNCEPSKAVPGLTPIADKCGVVYFTSFVKLCFAGNAKLSFPPAQSERLYRQAGLFVDFGQCPETVPEILDYEEPWMWLQQNCGRLFFTRSYPDAEELKELAFSFGDPMWPEPFFEELSKKIQELPQSIMKTHTAKDVATLLQLENRPPWRIQGRDLPFVYTDDELVNIAKYIEYYLKISAMLEMNHETCLDPFVVGKLKEFDSSALSALDAVSSVAFGDDLTWITKNVRKSLDCLREYLNLAN